MDVKKYLERIGVNSGVKPDLETLRLLHTRHLYNIPFENLDIHSGRKIILDEKKLLHKIVNEKRGGFCYELNGAFYALLKAIGFSVKRISAGVYENGNGFSADFDHMALIVNTGDEEFLADVGFGDSFIEPPKFKTEKVQEDKAGFFKISESEDNGHYILYRSSDGNEFAPQYKFSLVPRELNEYEAMCRYHQTSPESHFMQKVICSKATESGRISISDLKLITTSGETKEQRIITEDEFYSLLKSRFKISLHNKIKFPSR